MGKTSKKKQRVIERRQGIQDDIKRGKLEKKDEDSNILMSGPIKKAYESLSPEEKERYRKIGEDLYGHVDFNTGEIKQEVDATADLMALIRSGLHPRELSGEELGFLSASLGSEWYKKFGYTKEDIDGKPN